MIVRNQKYLNRSGCLFSAVALAALLSVPAGASSFCVEVGRDGVLWRSMRAAPGDEFLLSFQHSIYNSRVEEVFRLRSNGFQLIELRYAERRLVEFYGHERADYRNGAWIVRPQTALIPSLHLRASSDAAFSLSLTGRGAPVRLAIPGNGTVLLTPATCKDIRDG